jgi:hypothetical protein
VLKEAETFAADGRLIHSDPKTFKRLMTAARFILERAPFVNSRCVDEERGIWTRVFPPHKTTNGLDVPEVLVSYEVVRQPPDGLILLRHVRTKEDIDAGLHVGDDPYLEEAIYRSAARTSAGDP